MEIEAGLVIIRKFRRKKIRTHVKEKTRNKYDLHTRWRDQG